MSGALVTPQQKKSLIVNVADMIVSNDGDTELITRALGSCLGLAVYDPIAHAGGLLHVLLPDSRVDLVKAQSHPHLFVDTGAPRLLDSICELGGERDRMLIKVAGGAEFLGGGGVFNIGARNIKALQTWLHDAGHRLEASALGGRSARTMKLEMATGRVLITSPGENPYEL